ncbi:MAG: lytic transglycosylase domain-containing protein [Rhizobiales bacterium]|nr:lytic transglycosylase domain-containing protein [Hyphomicrobiales bacterium]
MLRFFSISFLAFTLISSSFITSNFTEALAAVPLPVKKSSTGKASNIKLAKTSKEKAKEKVKPKGPYKLSLNDELSALNNLELSHDDKTNLNKAIKAIFKNKKETADKLIAKISNTTAKKLAKWYAYRNRKIIHDYSELTEFIKNNPSWPSRSRLVSKIEARLFKGALPAKEAHDYFTKHKPKSLAGKCAHAEALFHLGKKEEATSLIRAAWQDPRLPDYLAKFILSKFPLMLRPEDHKIRVDRLLYASRKARANAAIRTAKKVGAQEEAAARFRAAVVKRQFRHARKLFSKLDDKTKAWPGVHLSRIELARRSKKYDHANKLMLSANYKAEDIRNKDKWWTERRRLTRQAISENKYETAYKIASGHKGPSVNKYNEAEFLSGWLALQFLKKPKVAEKHFENFKQAADGPRTRSKSAYWMGRTQQKLNNKKKAEENFKQSAKMQNTYYGQLSAHALGEKNKSIKIPGLTKINSDIAQRFTSREEVKAVALAHLAGERSIARIFFSHLRYQFTEPSELTLLAKLAADLGFNQSAVRIGKTALSQGVPITHYAYPTQFMPSFTPLRSIPEQALIYSIARQESEFNYKIRSHAGARGLLQVMPNTLKHVARKYKIKRQVAWLTQKPAYNAKIGSAYIGDRHDEFGGSYIMTFAGFNAGPGRVRQWVKKFGDPRSKNIDPIDWVERIPFKETRNYVQKVLANVQVYRARLSSGEGEIKTYQDLHRGRF